VNWKFRAFGIVCGLEVSLLCDLAVKVKDWKGWEYHWKIPVENVFPVKLKKMGFLYYLLGGNRIKKKKRNI
jgi:hypothetical protein